MKGSRFLGVGVVMAMSKSLFAAYPRRAWLTAMACGVGSMFGASALYAGTFPFFVPAMMREFHWDQATIFGVFSISVLLSPFSLPVAGRLVDRLGLRGVVIPATIAYAVCLMGMFIVPAEHLLLGALFVGIGVSGFVSTVGVFAKVISQSFDRHRGLMLAAVLGGAGSLGPAIGIPLVQWGVQTIGWRETYLAIGLAILIVVVPVHWLLLREPARSDPQPLGTGAGAHIAPSVSGLTVRQAVATREFWLVIVASALGASAIMALRQHAVLLFSELGYRPERAAVAMSALSLATLVGQIAAGTCLDRATQARWVIASFTLCPLLGVLLYILAPHAFPAMLIASVLIGVGSGSEMGFLPFLVGRYFGLRAYAEIQGYMLIVITITLGLAPVVVGVLHDRIGSYDAILKGLWMVLFFSSLLFLPLPKYKYAQILTGGVDTAGR
ncbi:MFS transporter [soil metagenome]